MRQAIVTKYLGPTNHKPGRVKATCEAGSITVSWDHALGVADNHYAACVVLTKKLGWPGTWQGGGLPNNAGYAFVHVRD